MAELGTDQFYFSGYQITVWLCVCVSYYISYTIQYKLYIILWIHGIEKNGNSWVTVPHWTLKGACRCRGSCGDGSLTFAKFGSKMEFEHPRSTQSRPPFCRVCLSWLFPAIFQLMWGWQVQPLHVRWHNDALALLVGLTAKLKRRPFEFPFAIS